MPFFNKSIARIQDMNDGPGVLDPDNHPQAMVWNGTNIVSMNTPVVPAAAGVWASVSVPLQIDIEVFPAPNGTTIDGYVINRYNVTDSYWDYQITFLYTNDILTYSDTLVNNDTTYYYVARNFSEGVDGSKTFYGKETASNEITVINKSLPSDPIDFSATVIGNVVTLEWTPIDNTDSFALSYGYNFGGSGYSASVDNPATPQVVIMPQNTTYTFYLTTWNSVGRSDGISVTAVVDVATILQPDSVIVANVNSNGECIFNITIPDNANAYTIDVDYSMNGTDWSATVRDTVLTNSSTYPLVVYLGPGHQKLRARLNGPAGSSDWTLSDYVDIYLGQAPSDAAAIYITNTTVLVQWSSQNTFCSIFEILSCADSEILTGTQIVKMGFIEPLYNDKKYLITGLTPNTTYYFRIKTTDGFGNYISDVINVTTRND